MIQNSKLSFAESSRILRSLLQFLNVANFETRKKLLKEVLEHLKLIDCEIQKTARKYAVSSSADAACDGGGGGGGHGTVVNAQV